MSDKIKENQSVFGAKEKHESYGVLRFSRAHCSSPVPLFGSTLKHNDIIRMELCEAYTVRELNEDWFFDDGKVIAEVDMSSTQFSDLITSLNMGSGVPVTIRCAREGKLKKMEEPPFVNRSEVHKQEFENHLKKSLEDCNALMNKLNELFNTKKTLNKQDKKDILDSVKRIAQDIGVNTDFQLEQFDRFMDKSRTEAKGEIESFFQNRIHSIAKDTIAENPQVLLGNPINLGEDEKGEK